MHLRKLEDAGYACIDKRFEARRPVTRCTLMEAGRGAWIAYLDRMRAMLFDHAPGPGQQPSAKAVGAARLSLARRALRA